MRTLLRGVLPRPVYVELLRNLFAIYETLELRLELGSHPLLGPLVARPGLARAEALRADLDALSAAPWSDWPLLPPTERYVARLGALARATPERLLAHAYVRYLGDLHGGQLLRARVERSLGDEGGSTCFYTFGDDDAVRAHIDAVRAHVDDVGRRHPEHCDAIVDEALQAFHLHGALFEALAPPGSGLDGARAAIRAE